MPTFYDRFVECAERWPQNVALEIQCRDRTESFTYAETRQMAESLGRWLEEQQLEPGTRCAILADNHPRWVVTFLGIIAAGCTAVPLDTAFHADQVAKLLKDSGAALIFSDKKHFLISQEAVRDMPVKIVVTNPSDEISGVTEVTGTDVLLASADLPVIADLDLIFASGSGNFSPRVVDSQSLVSLLYTSGTTADPKGVMLTHDNLMGEVNAVYSWAKLGPDDAILGVLPLFHVLSQMANLLLPLVNGAHAVFLETLNTTELIRALSERGITAFAVVPQFFYLVHERIFKEAAKKGALTRFALRWLMKLNRGLRKIGINAGPVFFGKIHKTFGSKMRFLVTGGSRFDPQIGHDFYALGIDVLQAYGLTETTGGAFVNPPNDNVIGSVGKALKGVEGKILNPQPQESGPPVGEIAIRGTLIMKAYWNRPDATAEVLKDGWLHTGDLGYFDADNNLFITGRMKEVIVLSNGKNVYPEEIEAYYLKTPYIKELCVMGIEGTPGDPTSERLHAVVVPNFEVLRERKIVNVKEVIRFDIESLSAQMASTKRIGSYEIWQEDLPRTTTRKLKRFEIEKRVRANWGKTQGLDAEISNEKPLTEEETAWMERDDVQRAIAILRESARKAPARISPNHNLELDLGLDSMQRVETLVALEQELGGDVEESQLAGIYTVREFVDVVRESAASGKKSTRAEFAGWDSVLKDASCDSEFREIAEPHLFKELFWFVVSRFVKWFSLVAFRLKVNGQEKIPAKGPFLLCSNHQSFLDAIIMAAYLPWPVFRKSFAVGTSEIFGTGFMRTLARWLRVVVVDPDANLIPAMRAGSCGLRHGCILILYPEGERTIDGTVRTFKKGAAILSAHLQVPIVPVAIDGFFDAWPRGKFFQKFAPLKMMFGDTILPPNRPPISEADYENLTADLKTKVVAMWEKLHSGKAGSGTK
ncbi:MAG TPA: AMP-binding protein [Terriglobales bacterium]